MIFLSLVRFVKTDKTLPAAGSLFFREIRQEFRQDSLLSIFLRLIFIDFQTFYKRQLEKTF
ncbi:hypothetical protein YDYSG_22510 [Paenibacillus tyrfis]|nr:hypothetical protein YDYSG_22510 [Paenibacillus tyrfis]